MLVVCSIETILIATTGPSPPYKKGSGCRDNGGRVGGFRPGEDAGGGHPSRPARG